MSDLRNEPQIETEMNNEEQARILQAARRLVAVDGHTTKCLFTGCTCGAVENYKAARTEFLRLLRELSLEKE
jgi:uncharacterized protein YchJ